MNVNKQIGALTNKRKVITKSGYFLKEDISLFDAPFFSITIKEAETMDPMHRLMLEVAYEGLENAGIPISKIAGTDTGCFVGCFTRDFDQMTGADVYSVAPYAATGGGATMLSNRVSWFYNLKGPSLSVDTACSSGITALHIACQSIKQGDATTVSRTPSLAYLYYLTQTVYCWRDQPSDLSRALPGAFSHANDQP